MLTFLQSRNARIIGAGSIAFVVIVITGVALWHPGAGETLTPPPLAGSSSSSAAKPVGTTGKTSQEKLSAQDPADGESTPGASSTTPATSPGAGAAAPSVSSNAAAPSTASSGASVSPSAAAPPPVQLVMVHVAGRVRAPNVYELPPTARIIDAVQKAGGCLPDADADAVNMAAHVQDGEQIYIPSRTVVAQMIAPGTAAMRAPVGRAPLAGAAAMLPPARSTRSRAAAGTAPGAAAHPPHPQKLKDPAQGLVDLNTASVEQLVLLPGVGPSTADKILEFRKTNGKFTSVQDVMNVKGIGPAKFAKMQPFLTVR